jgi:hypothetical protein
MPRAKKADTPVLEEAVGPLVKTDEKIEGDIQDLDTAIGVAKQKILAIDERAEFAIQVVTQSIRTQAAVAKGQVLNEIRPLFDEGEYEGKWHQFLADLNLRPGTALQWMNSAKLIEEKGAQYGESFLMEFSYGVLNSVQTLPEAVKEAVLEDAVEAGKPLSATAISEISKAPQTKLAAVFEKMEAKQARLAELETQSGEAASDERYQVKKKLKQYEESLEQLKSQIAEEKIKAEQKAKDTERLEAELELLKYDDEAAREQRVKRVASSLIVSLPAVLSDLQKYVAEKEFYPSKQSKSIDDSIETLVNFLKPLYA